MYKCSSGADKGILYQLRNLVRRWNVVSDLSRNINACEDFIVEVNVLAATMSVFKMSSVDDKPTSILFTEDCFSLSKEDRMTILQLEIGNVIDRYV